MPLVALKKNFSPQSHKVYKESQSYFLLLFLFVVLCGFVVKFFFPAPLRKHFMLRTQRKIKPPGAVRPA
jgi:hypothetical protein